MKYKVIRVPKVEGIYDLPVGVIPLQIGLMITEAPNDQDTRLVDRLVDCIKCLVLVEEAKDELES